jgi:hypothetical protein
MKILGWLCYRIVMAWPGEWPRGAVAGWILALAGDYANETPNAKVGAGGTASDGLPGSADDASAAP